MRLKGRHTLLVLLGCTSIALMYLFQKTDYFSYFLGWVFNSEVDHSHLRFIFNKTFRLVVNDLGCFLLIAGIFQERKYLVISFYVFLVELFLILPLYFFIKLSLEGVREISSPLLSFVHRLIVNPMLMFLLMLGFVYQILQEKKSTGGK